MLVDVALHMVLEAIGGGIMLYALSFCKHISHRFMVWFVLALAFSFLTVISIG